MCQGCQNQELMGWWWSHRSRKVTQQWGHILFNSPRAYWVLYQLSGPEPTLGDTALLPLLVTGSIPSRHYDIPKHTSQCELFTVAFADVTTQKSRAKESFSWSTMKMVMPSHLDSYFERKLSFLCSKYQSLSIVPIQLQPSLLCQTLHIWVEDRWWARQKHTQGDIALCAYRCVYGGVGLRSLNKAVVWELGSVGWVRWSPWQRERINRIL